MGIRHNYTAKIIPQSESGQSLGLLELQKTRCRLNDTMNHPLRRAVTPILHPHPEIQEEIKNVWMF